MKPHNDETTEKKAVLLVEDEIYLRMSIARAVSAHGHQVDEAGTCQDAVNAVTSNRYDILLLDINLPDATGWDVLRQLNGSGRRPRTIVFSAVPPSASRVREFRPDGVLQKPFPIDALLRLIEGAPGSEVSDAALSPGTPR